MVVINFYQFTMMEDHPLEGKSSQYPFPLPLYSVRKRKRQTDETFIISMKWNSFPPIISSRLIWSSLFENAAYQLDWFNPPLYYSYDVTFPLIHLSNPLTLISYLDGDVIHIEYKWLACYKRNINNMESFYSKSVTYN